MTHTTETIITITLVILTGVVVIAGCSRDGLPGLVPAAGIVTLNGEPVEGAIISFAPGPDMQNVRSASAMSDRNGRFAVSTLNHADGMFPGEYQVFLTKTTGTGGDISPEEAARQGGGGDRQVVHHLPLKYANRDTSGLTVSIPPRGNRNIELALEGDVDLTPQRPGATRR
jgi:hypothetical protein